ncbi:YjaG family protein [Aliiglaciecola sp. LCG003]|uniref:YjaG family protein n=1 Tax=Aliiglaciecola sp. LCG003 TaxID=3053655 RepID=UPI00257252C9|nr:YjaG family protein [Aliiglaciecola sp. LCG003]WJG09138.1 YjaG family protein [Aliiglaciecola sp. LCG003]
MNTKLNTFQRVRELTGWHAVAFAATLVQRMQPNYQLFCQATEYSDAEQFRKSLESIWQWLGRSGTKINFALQLDKVEEATPDAADFDNYGVYPAIDAAISLAATISLIMNDEPQGAVMVSKLSQGCVEAFVEAVAGESLSAEEIKQHPLMAWEVEFQTELLDALHNMSPSSDSIKLLKKLAVEEGVSNIGIEI